MKKICLLFLLLLCSCRNNRAYACDIIDDDKQIYLDIKAINDEIVSIEAKEVFIIPYNILMNEKLRQFLDEQLDSSYYFEDNKLIKKYNIVLDDVYSLNMTIDYLKKERFFCE